MKKGGDGVRGAKREIKLGILIEEGSVGLERDQVLGKPAWTHRISMANSPNNSGRGV